MDSLRHALHETFKSTAEKFIPARSQSGFREQGVLTPDEFLCAGDYLVRVCPTWSWEAGDPKKAKPYLPKDKQYLVTRNVPCVRRAATVEQYGGQAGELLDFEGDEEGWVTTRDTGAGVSGSIEDISSEVPHSTAPLGDSVVSNVDDDDVPDIDDLDLEDDTAPDEAALPDAPPGDDILRTRTYDLMITYDKYYQVPRFWLSGYDEQRQPLQPVKALEDVSEEHARKTITIDPFPHGSVQVASIHPCKHAHTMKRLAEVMGEGGAEVSVEGYLVLFLKFIASVVPTIEYDYTMSAGGQ